MITEIAWHIVRDDTPYLRQLHPVCTLTSRRLLQAGTGEALARERLSPVGEGQVGGHDGTAPFVPSGEDLEQEFGSGFGEGEVPVVLLHAWGWYFLSRPAEWYHC